MDDLYQENILEHASSPRNKVALDFDLKEYILGEGKNPSCGDNGNVYVRFDNLKISDAKFTGQGCAISMAAMSMLTEYTIGKNIHDLKNIMPGDIYKMLGVKITPARVGCALLSYRALEQVLIKYDTQSK